MSSGEAVPASMFLLIPTFRELAHLRRLIGDLQAQSVENFHAVVINSDPGDATSAFVAETAAGRSLRELPADPSTYWSGAIEIGQRWLLQIARPGDLVVLLNADVRLPSDFLERTGELVARFGRAMVMPATVDGDSFVSSGCRMLSWPLGLSRHVLVGPRRDAGSAPIAVDMLAGRALAFPARALWEVGLMAARHLPHYGADYEYTARARRRGYRLYVFPGLQIVNDSAHTGVKSSNPRTTLADRVKGLTSIKSTSNLKCRSRFVLLTYPWYSIPSGLLVTWVKIALEVGLGETVYRVFTLRHG
jgi:GT2 family glycosyltransferase